MTHLDANLSLDTEILENLPTYYLYRSREERGDRPIVDGVYLQRKTLGVNPPKTMKLLLEWN